MLKSIQRTCRNWSRHYILNGLDHNQKKSIIRGYNFERGKNNPVNVQTEDLIKIF